MPVEFSVAAYRLGHSMVRGAYDWNHVFDDGGGALGLLFEFSGTSGDLGGGPRLPSNWIADFRRLYDFREAGRNDLRPIVRGRNRLNVARRIDTLLTDPLVVPARRLDRRPRPAARSGTTSPSATSPARNMLKLATGQQMVGPDARTGRDADGAHRDADPRRQQGRDARPA